MSEISATDQEVTITRNGRVEVVLVNYEEFESWMETIAVVLEPEFLAEVRQGIESLKKGQGRLFRKKELDRLFADECDIGACDCRLRSPDGGQRSRSALLSCGVY